MARPTVQCKGIRLHVQSGRLPFSRCEKKIHPSQRPYCKAHQKTAERQAIITAVLGPDWEERQALACGSEVKKKRAKGVPTIDTEQVLEDLRWWEQEAETG